MTKILSHSYEESKTVVDDDCEDDGDFHEWLVKDPVRKLHFK